MIYHRQPPPSCLRQPRRWIWRQWRHEASENLLTRAVAKLDREPRTAQLIERLSDVPERRFAQVGYRNTQKGDRGKNPLNKTWLQYSSGGEVGLGDKAPKFSGRVTFCWAP